MRTARIAFAGATVATLLAASMALAGDYRSQAIAMIKRDFHTRGIAGTDRLEQDGVVAVCNRTGDNPPKEIGQFLEAEQLAAVKYPADGKLMGDWQKGEAVAQSGRGMTWADQPGTPVGGSCYNCHRIGPKETAFGTIGPSLYNFGKLRGNGPEIQKYVYGKIYNAKAYNLCTAMPRFGTSGALTETQIKDLVGLLLDPESPVNK